MVVIAVGLVVPSMGGAAGSVEVAPARFRVQGDGIVEPLAGATGDAARGRRVAVQANQGNCTVCHALPVDEVTSFGNVGPPLAGVGSRLSEAQLRLRVVDARQVNARSVMPPYHRVDGLHRVAPGYRGRPVLSAQEVEDLVAYLVSLK
jgi:sulfur-oxidizing protein SoxX